MRNKIQGALGIAKAVGQGYMDNAREHKAFNQQADREVLANPSGSRVEDVKRVGRRINELEKTEGKPLKAHIRKRLDDRKK